VNVLLGQLVEEFQSLGLILQSAELAERCVTGVASVEACRPGDLVFVDDARHLAALAERRPAAVICSPKLRAAATALADVAIVTAPNVRLAHAMIKQRHGSRDFVASGWQGVHPSAVLHDTAIVGDGTVIEPRAVIGRHARIGARCRIMAGAVIENDAQIGDDCIIGPAALIGYGCRLGNQVDVGPGSVIGSEGFGFAQDAQRRSHRIPQTGIVVIGDRVRIGANNCIDRATYGETRIGAGTKFDNLCHVAHNVTIGEDCLLTAMLCVAGSSNIGNRVVASGQTGIIDHIDICDDVVLVHRAGVVKDIAEPGVHASLPGPTST
jgi:UDP-3-O-[3-hydroxymyristoyl] glucosamine N-acyltransferase